MLTRLLSAFALAVLLAVPGAHAQQAPVAPVIVVVDFQQILQDSAASKAIQKQLDAQREIYQKEIASQEDKLRTVQQELARQRTILSADAFAQKQRDFEKQVADVQRAVQGRKRALDQAFNDSMGQVRSTALQIVADVAAERRANIVLNKQQVVLVEKGLDVTDTVMERVNKKLPTVKVSVPKS